MHESLGMSLNFGQILPLTTELAALKILKLYWESGTENIFQIGTLVQVLQLSEPIVID